MTTVMGKETHAQTETGEDVGSARPAVDTNRCGGEI